MRKNIFERFGEFQEEWVALTPDEKKLLIHSPCLSTVVQVEKKVGRPVYVRIPQWDTNYAASCLP